MDHMAKQYLIPPYCERDIYIYIWPPSAVREAIIQEVEFQLYFHAIACLVLPCDYASDYIWIR